MVLVEFCMHVILCISGHNYLTRVAFLGPWKKIPLAPRVTTDWKPIKIFKSS